MMLIFITDTASKVILIFFVLYGVAFMGVLVALVQELFSFTLAKIFPSKESKKRWKLFKEFEQKIETRSSLVSINSNNE